MSLIDDLMTPAIFMEKVRNEDGEGGFITVWQEGAEFEAAITFDSSMQARAAENDGLTSLYTVTIAKNVPLEYHDVIKRISDGKILRITSNPEDVETPKRAGFSFKQCTAESWRLT